MKKILILLLLLILVFVGYEFWPKNLSTMENQENKEATMKSVGLANPASVNCKDKGGELVIQKTEDGGEYGVCYFDDARGCEEWAMFRGECPVGGVKTTGFDTIDQRFCAWSGGTTSAVENSICEFKNGKKCSTKDFYLGECSSN